MANWSVNAVMSAPSLIPSVLGADKESTVHSTNVELALCLFADERAGVSSGARMVKTSVKSSRLETLGPLELVGVPTGAPVKLKYDRPSNRFLNYDGTYPLRDLVNISDDLTPY